MTTGISEAAWPMTRVGVAVQSLARASGLHKHSIATAPEPNAATLRDPPALERWIDRVATGLGVEAQAIETTYADLEAFVTRAGPAILAIEIGGVASALALVRGGPRAVTLLGPDLALKQVSRSELLDALRAQVEAPIAAEMDRFLEACSVEPHRRSRAAKALMREQLAGVRVGRAWILRRPASAPFIEQLRAARLGGALVGLVFAHAAENALVVLAWWMLGKGALEGRVDPGWLAAWALLLLTQVPCRVATTRLRGSVAVHASALVKRRLMAGALALTPEEMRGEGAGQFLGRIIEGEAFESLALNGGFLAIAAIVQLGVAFVVLAFGAAPVVEPLLLAGWTGLLLFLSYRHLDDRRRWTDGRLSLTHDLVERMLGHRTRVAQEPLARWHDGEDASIDGYLALSRRMDARASRMQALLPRGWMLIAMVGLAWPLVVGTVSLASLAISLGGMLLAYRAEKALAQSLTSLAGAAIAWRRVAGLLDAGKRLPDVGSPEFTPGPTAFGPSSGLLFEAHDVVFRYRNNGAPVLNGCSLRIGGRDRALLEGASGGGKSTLGLVFAGVRVPESGLLLLDGLDGRTLGSLEWRRRIVTAPQFHDNHVFCGSFAYNLLMGRRWPPRQADLDEAEAICRELDLGGVIAKMPAGIQQMVGETGWQLSHGEKSRLYMARALLQDPELVVLDEAFASLDPETMRRSLECVLRRARALLIIGHV